MLLLALHETTCDHSLLNLHVNFYCKALLCLIPVAELTERSAALFRRLILLVVQDLFIFQSFIYDYYFT